MIEHLRIDSHGIGKKTSGIQDHVPGLGSEAWHHSINDDLTDDGVSSAISSLNAATASKCVKTIRLKESVIFTFHVVFRKRKDSIKSGSCKPEAKIIPTFV